MEMLISWSGNEYLIAFPPHCPSPGEGGSGWHVWTAGMTRPLFYGQALGFDLSLQHVDRIAQDAIQLNELAAGVKACFHTADVEQVVDQTRDLLNTLLDAFQKILLQVIEGSRTFNELAYSRSPMSEGNADRVKRYGQTRSSCDPSPSNR
jgi:hypothetical protein